MKLIVNLLLLLCSTYVFAQVDLNSIDNQLGTVREIAFDDKDFAKAINVAESSLKANPNQQQLEILLSRLFFWSNNIEEAKHYTDSYLSKYPEDIDGYFLKIDILENQQDFESAQSVISQAAILFDDNQKLQFRKAYNLSLLGDYGSCKHLLKEIIQKDTANLKAIQLLEEVKTYKTNQFVVARYHGFIATEELVAINQLQLLYGRKFNKSTFILRMNGREILGEKALQGQIEWYKALSKNVYTHSYFAYSDSDLFPRYNFGGGVYFEYANGMQYFFTANHIKSNFAKASILSAGIYKRHQMLALQGRLFYTIEEEQNKASFICGIRRYFGDDGVYLGLNYGVIPQQEIYTLNNINSLNARFIGPELSYPFLNKYELKLQYNRNIKKYGLERDQFSLFAKCYF